MFWSKAHILHRNICHVNCQKNHMNESNQGRKRFKNIIIRRTERRNDQNRPNCALCVLLMFFIFSRSFWLLSSPSLSLSLVRAWFRLCFSSPSLFCRICCSQPLPLFAKYISTGLLHSVACLPMFLQFAVLDHDKNEYLLKIQTPRHTFNNKT